MHARGVDDRLADGLIRLIPTLKTAWGGGMCLVFSLKRQGVHPSTSKTATPARQSALHVQSGEEINWPPHG